MGYGLPPAARTSSSACSQLFLMPIPKPSATSRTSAPMIRDSRMLPTRSLTESGQSTQLSWTSLAFRPSLAVTASWASASGTRYSSLRVLFPPKASPELQSSRLAQMAGPPRWAVSRSSGWTGLGPNSSGYRGKSARDTGATDPSDLEEHVQLPDGLVDLPGPGA